MESPRPKSPAAAKALPRAPAHKLLSQNLLLAVWVAGAGCGLGLIEDHSGGGEHLPTRGAGPYAKLGLDLDTPADEPYVVSESRVNLRDPAPLWRDGGGFRLWFGYEDDPSGAQSAIWFAELRSLTELPDTAPRPALTADEPWEQGWVGAPSVVALGEGKLVMFYQGGRDEPAIGRADSSDNGATWQKNEANPVLDRAGEPGAVYVPVPDSGPDPKIDPELDWLLYLTRPERDGIFRADSADGVTWHEHEPPVLLPRSDRDGAFDQYRVSSPFPVLRRTAAGHLHYGLFFNGADGPGDDAVISVGWAGSFDGFLWHRLTSPDEPVLAAGVTSEHSPSVLLGSDRGIMFFNEQRQGAQSIAAAVHQ